MKKNYGEPELIVNTFANLGIMTTSGTGIDPNGQPVIPDTGDNNGGDMSEDMM